MARKKTKTATAARKGHRSAATKIAKRQALSVVPTSRTEGNCASGNAKQPAESKKYLLGSSSIFTPEVMNDIHIKSELGRYRMRGFSMFKKIPHWDDLTFLPGTLTRFVI